VDAAFVTDEASLSLDVAFFLGVFFDDVAFTTVGCFLGRPTGRRIAGGCSVGNFILGGRPLRFTGGDAGLDNSSLLVAAVVSVTTSGLVFNDFFVGLGVAAVDVTSFDLFKRGRPRFGLSLGCKLDVVFDTPLCLLTIANDVFALLIDTGLTGHLDVFASCFDRFSDMIRFGPTAF
jgi:hypothetical protein